MRDCNINARHQEEDVPEPEGKSIYKEVVVIGKFFYENN